MVVASIKLGVCTKCLHYKKNGGSFEVAGKYVTERSTEVCNTQFLVNSVIYQIHKLERPCYLRDRPAV